MLYKVISLREHKYPEQFLALKSMSKQYFKPAV